MTQHEAYLRYLIMETVFRLSNSIADSDRELGFDLYVPSVPEECYVYIDRHDVFF